MLKKLVKNCYLRQKDKLSNDFSSIESDEKIEFVFTNEYKLVIGKESFMKPVTEIVVKKEEKAFVIPGIFGDEGQENRDFIMSLREYQIILSIVDNTIYLTYYPVVLRDKNITISNLVFNNGHVDIYAYLGTEFMTVHQIAEVTGGDTALLLNKCAVVHSVLESFPHSFDNVEGVMIMSENRYYSDIELTPGTILLYGNNHIYLKDVFANADNYEFIYKDNLVCVNEKGVRTYTRNGEVCTIDENEESMIIDLITSILNEFEEALTQEFERDDSITAELIYNKIRSIKLELTENEIIQKYKGIEIVDLDDKKVVRLDKELIDHMDNVLIDLHKLIEINA